MKKGGYMKGKGPGPLMSPTSFGGSSSYFDTDYNPENPSAEWPESEVVWTGYEAEAEWDNDE
eukprot:5026158-Amphidinium_carterae.1